MGSAKIIEGQFKTQRHRGQLLNAKTRADVRDVSDDASSYADLTGKEQQSAFGNLGSASRSPLERSLPLIKVVQVFIHPAQFRDPAHTRRIFYRPTVARRDGAILARGLDGQ